MNEKPMTEEVARRFLLGAVDDSEREQIESLFIIDPETEQTILIAEDELVEDYLEGSLSPSDSAKFLEQYAKVPRQQRRLRIAASIREYALSEAQRIQPGTSPVQKLRGFVSLPWPREPRWYIPIAVTVIGLVITAIWLVQWNNQRMRETNLRSALERELTELNSTSSLSKDQPQMLSVVLPPVSLRSVRPSEVASRSTYQIIEFQLLWTHKKEFQSYLAVLRRVGGAEEFNIPNLQAEKNSAGRVVRLRLPAEALARGDYKISLSAIPDGPTEQYDLVVAD
jgi:hypothetical protein